MYNVRMMAFFEVFIALRYLRIRQRSRRNHFISFISLTSMLGVALGVTALIVVLSVMNGFEKELRERTMGMAAHATLHSFDGELSDWQTLANELDSHPQVTGVAPYVNTQGMLSHGGYTQGVSIRGILPGEEVKVSSVAKQITRGDLGQLEKQDFAIAIGVELAQALQVDIGDTVTLLSARVNRTPVGVLPRLKQFSVVAIFEVGMHEFDSALAIIHLDSACKLLRCEAPSSLRIRTTESMRAPAIVNELRVQLKETAHTGIWLQDWTARHSNLFYALRVEKTVMFVILSLIIAVASFNIVSSLVMTVAEKRSDIAILRTMGAGRHSIMALFMLQGTMIGLIGGLTGLVAGVLFSTKYSYPDTTIGSMV